MNQMQAQAMSRVGEHGEPIFRTPCSVGSGEVAELRKALRELLEAWMTEMPIDDAKAQDAWADRRAQARNSASVLIAKSGAAIAAATEGAV